MKRKYSIFALLALLLALSVLPVHAQEGLYYTTDDADILNDEEDINLEYSLQSISEEHNIGVYLVTVEDYTDRSDGSVYEMTEELYHEYTMGKGEERNGIMLLLSMAERDYALFVYGKEAEAIFDAAALQQLEEAFLPHFADNDWYEGFCAYMLTCMDHLERVPGAEAETEEVPVPEEPTKAAQAPAKKSKLIPCLLVIGGGFLIALIAVCILKAGMKNVSAKQEASTYISRDLNLSQSHDQFTHTTHLERKIQTKSSSGSVSRSGGGGHGRSGKF